MNAPRNAATRVFAPACWAMNVWILPWPRTAEQAEQAQQAQQAEEDG